MKGSDVHSQRKRRTLALCVLVLLFVAELLFLEFEVEWLWGMTQAVLPEFGYAETLKSCPADVRVLKSQHFAVLTMLLPLKAVCVYMCGPERIVKLQGRGLLEKAWGLLFILLYISLGMVFAYVVLFELPGAPSLSSRSALANLSPCALPTLAYVLKLSFASIVAAVCLWPVILIASSLLHRIFVRIDMHFHTGRVRQQ